MDAAFFGVPRVGIGGSAMPWGLVLPLLRLKLLAAFWLPEPSTRSGSAAEMAALIFDASGIVKRYVQKIGTGWIQGLVDPVASHEVFVAVFAHQCFGKMRCGDQAPPHPEVSR